MARPTISMPNSFSNKPGFYDDGESPTTNSQTDSNKKSADTNKSAQDTKKRPNGSQENAKRFVERLLFTAYTILKPMIMFFNL